MDKKSLFEGKYETYTADANYLASLVSKQLQPFIELFYIDKGYPSREIYHVIIDEVAMMMCKARIDKKNGAEVLNH